MLNGIQIGVIGKKVRELYRKDDFENFLFTRLDKNYEDLTAESSYPNEVTRILDTANRRGWAEDLLMAIEAENPKDKELTKLMYDLGIGIGGYNQKEGMPIVSATALQNIVNATPQQNIAEILDGISFSKRCICRIEIPVAGGQAYGTGFLIGPDLILTNYHVAEPFFANGALVPGVVCRFDYEAKADGTIYYAGTQVALHESFHVASSPYSALDKAGTAPLTEDWPLDQLDYALLRLEREIGNEPVTFQNGRATSDAPPRGWIKPAPANTLLLSGGHLHIIQHPEGQPLKIAFGFEKLIGLSNNGSRVRYEVNTLRGSSGSPCFNEKFQWVALHNLGDPAWVPTYNQGISAKTIISHIRTNFNNVTIVNDGFTSTT